jgi:hypothetical protein
MGSNENIIGLVVVLVVVAIGLVFFDLRSLNFDSENGDVEERDSYGCLVLEGYSWNASESACVLEWEIGVKRYQIVDFVTCADAGYAVMESNPRQCRAPNGNVFVE